MRCVAASPRQQLPGAAVLAYCFPECCDFTPLTHPPSSFNHFAVGSDTHPQPAAVCTAVLLFVQLSLGLLLPALLAAYTWRPVAAADRVSGILAMPRVAHLQVGWRGATRRHDCMCRPQPWPERLPCQLARGTMPLIAAAAVASRRPQRPLPSCPVCLASGGPTHRLPADPVRQHHVQPGQVRHRRQRHSACLVEQQQPDLSSSSGCLLGGLSVLGAVQAPGGDLCHMLTCLLLLCCARLKTCGQLLPLCALYLFTCSALPSIYSAAADCTV